MKCEWRNARGVILILGVFLQAPFVCAESGSGMVQSSPNGIEFPFGYEDWRLVSMSHRTDNNTLRVILGNDAAVVASRSPGKRYWPDGAVLAKLVWKEASHAEWTAAAVPGSFVHVEFMVRDRKRFPFTGGWGFARWVGDDREPFGEDEKFDRECFGCHQQVANTDYVFTRPVLIGTSGEPAQQAAD